MVTESLSLSPPIVKVWETCPNCRWRWISQICWDDVSHSLGAVCPKCFHQFLSAAAS